jgi:hypothetical protein
VHQHQSRVYFIGTNLPSSGFSLPFNPPDNLRNRIAIDRYRLFVANLNKRLGWSVSEKVLLNLIMVLYPPCLPIYLQKVRTNNCLRLIEALTKEFDPE